MEKVIAITENYKNKTKQEVTDFVTALYSPVLWGQVYAEYKPVILSKIFGDGLQLIWFQTLDQRPYYWYVFVDSKEDLKSDDFILSDIIEAIRDEFGEYGEIDDDSDDLEYCQDKFSETDGEYPSLKSDYCGTMWGQECLFEKL